MRGNNPWLAVSLRNRGRGNCLGRTGGLTSSWSLSPLRPLPSLPWTWRSLHTPCMVRRSPPQAANMHTLAASLCMLTVSRLPLAAARVHTLVAAQVHPLPALLSLILSSSPLTLYRSPHPACLPPLGPSARCPLPPPGKAGVLLGWPQCCPTLSQGAWTTSPPACGQLARLPRVLSQPGCLGPRLRRSLLQVDQQQLPAAFPTPCGPRTVPTTPLAGGATRTMPWPPQ